MFAIREANSAGQAAEIGSENGPQRSATHDKSMPVSFESEARGTGPFVGGQGFPKDFGLIGADGQWHDPDVGPLGGKSSLCEGRIL